MFVLPDALVGRIFYFGIAYWGYKFVVFLVGSINCLFSFFSCGGSLAWSKGHQYGGFEEFPFNFINFSRPCRALTFPCSTTLRTHFTTSSYFCSTPSPTALHALSIPPIPLWNSTLFFCSHCLSLFYFILQFFKIIFGICGNDICCIAFKKYFKALM